MAEGMGGLTAEEVLYFAGVDFGCLWADFQDVGKKFSDDVAGVFDVICKS